MNPPVSKKSNLKTEAVAGVTTFFTMAYIVVVNPQILSADGKTGMAFSGVLTATVIICFLMTLLMGLYAKLPFAVAPGMGINAFFTYTIILGKGVPWPTALGIIFWAGVFFLLISATPIRESIAKAIPREIRIAAAAGIGIFLTCIGLKSAGFVVADPVTFVKIGSLGKPALLTILGVAISIFLMTRHSPFAFLLTIVVITLVAWALGLVSSPAQKLSLPDFKSVFFKLDILGALKLGLVPSIIAILFTDLFDSISTFIGVAHAGGLLDDEGHPRNLRQGLIVDSLATMGAGLAGTSSGTAYIESIAGIEMGGRTGLTSVFTALCFLPCLFIAPIAGMVPPFATAAVLILVGAAMFRSVAEINFLKIEEGIPAFLTLILIPLTFSITQGILWGFISHVGLYLLVGRRRDIHPVMYALAVVSIGMLVLERFG
ncbi:MAG TPA: NCS2 family permease [Pyrinomonadaceae bacterium]|jgi:AGZA family xanthine/uracil permease-like MFS transporter|nr:NCS2 family permease [Pyrinomonadaceae bacterium]